MQRGVDVLVVLPDVQHDALVQRWRHPLALDLRPELGHVPDQGAVHDDAGILFVSVNVWREVVVELEGGRRGLVGVQQEWRLDVVGCTREGVTVVAVELQVHGS